MAGVLITAIGCGHGLYDVAPVSGTVTLYGEPLKNATVSFEPQAGSDQEIVGPGSSGQTDDSGRYKLTTFRGERGAVVGQHKVRISTYESRFKDLENYVGERARRGRKLPRGFQKVDRVRLE